ncbi:MAG: zf-TFIIB domain-containing protein [Planctomycetota bacterium]|nr:zf-TFIIB domain-containing protein [Planctomycetota bacterium]
MSRRKRPDVETRLQRTAGKPAVSVSTKPHDNSKHVPEGRRPCPICGDFMKSRKRGLLLVDVCAAHGIWLDKGELRSLEKSFSRRGIIMTKAREDAAYERGRAYEGSAEELCDWLRSFLG